MAYLFSYAQTFLNGSISAVAMNMPAHAANDILIAYITVDSGTVSFTGSSWVALPSAPANPVTNGIVSYLYYVTATGSSETMTLTTGDAYTCTIYCFRDCYVAGTAAQIFDSVTPVHASGGAGAYTCTATAVTTNTADSLIVYLVAQDTPSTLPSNVLTGPGVMWIDQNDSGGTTATTSAEQAAAWYINRATGACPTPTFTSSVTSTFVKVTFALRNKAGGRIPAYIDDVSSPGTMITGGHHIVAANDITYTTNGITATINGKTATPGTAVNGADFGINPFCNAVSLAAAQTAATALVGPEATKGTAVDASTGLICGSFIAGSPKMGTFGLGTVADGGVVVRFGSGAAGTNNWNAYQVSAKDAKVTTEQRCVFAIEAGYAGSAYATGSGGNCASNAVKYFQFLRNAPYFSSTVYTSEIHLVNKQIVAGGDATYPVDIPGLVAIGKSFRLPVIQQAGANGIVSFVPIQIGGGDAVNFQINTGAIQFPSRASVAAKDLQYHASDNKVGLYLAGVSGDVIKLTNSVITSNTPYVFEITSGATSAATWDLKGCTIAGATVTLRNVMTFTAILFTSCPSITVSNCTLNGCTISRVPTGNDTLTTNASTHIDYCTIDVSQVGSGNRWCSVADPTVFSHCSFTGGGGHAIRITTQGTYEFSGNTFASFGADGSNGAAIFNDSGGLVTLNITGGGGTPTVRNGSGASTTINNSVSLSITDLVTGSDIVVYAAGTTTVLDSIQNRSGTSWNYVYAGASTGNHVDIGVFLAGYRPKYVRDYILPATNGAVPAKQEIDRDYLE